jgi:acetolactate synthase-1/2/3 large subunit
MSESTVLMNSTPEKRTGGDVLVEVMKRHGIDTAFGVISVHNLPLVEAVSVFAATVPSADRAEAVLEEALAAVSSTPGGPASVEWPSDLQYLARPEDQQTVVVERAVPPRPDEAGLAAAAAVLAAAERPVLWLGGGAAGAAEQVAALARRLGAAVLTSNSGRAVIPEDDDLVIGNFASTSEVAPLLADADVMLSVGTHFRSNETRSYSLDLPKRHIQIDVDPAAVGRVYPAEVGLVGDARAVVAALLDRLPAGSPDPGWTARVRSVREQVRAELFDYIGGYAEICRGLRTVLPRESVVARDVTIPSSQWGNRLLEFYDRRSNIFPLGGGIGQGLAMGIGAAVGRPEAPTVVIAGDGGLSVHLGELASLGGTRAWCVVLVFNDGGYGVLRNMQRAHGFDVTAVDLFTPDFSALARSMDMPYWLVRGAGTFEEVLRAAVDARRPVMVEVDVTALEPQPGAFTPPVHIPTPNGRT